MKKRIITVFIATVNVILSYAQNVMTNGANGLAPTYPTLNDAITALNALPAITEPVVISLLGDDDPPANGYTITAVGSSNATITFIPVGHRKIEGAITAGNALITLDKADYIIFNGLNDGNNSLTISNTTVSGTSGTSTIRFINGATNNIITKCTILGAFTGSVTTNGGNIFFSTDGVTPDGNDYNEISYCNIGPVGNNYPSKCIYGNGSTTTKEKGNSGIVIKFNNIYDYFSPTTTSAGIYTNGGCNTWTIMYNRFYQTTEKVWTAGAQHSAIWLANSSTTSGAQGFVVTNNIIGYSSEGETGYYTLKGSASGKFVAIHYNGINGGDLTKINYNRIASIKVIDGTFSGTGTSSPFRIIYVGAGLCETNNNTIGSQIIDSSLVFTTNTTTSTDAHIFYNYSTSNWTIKNNEIGGIIVNNQSATGNLTLNLIYCYTGTSYNFTAESNLIGGTIENSIQNRSLSDGSQIFGIRARSVASTIKNNTIRNLAAFGGTGTGVSASIIGISTSAASSSTHTVSGNKIYSLINLNMTKAVNICGIVINATTLTQSVIEKNYIHSLTTWSDNSSSTLVGILAAGGNVVYKNNMIRLGLTPQGSAFIKGNVINGISDLGGDNKFYNNSVYIGGNNVTGTANTYALFNNSAGSKSYLNNIFVNMRTNGSGSGKHYAIRMSGTGQNPPGLIMDYNVYYVSGNGTMFGYYDNNDRQNLNEWKLAIGLDANSWERNPQFVNPDGDANTGDLHISNTVPTIIEGKGTNIADVTDDYDGEDRASLTPVDIGADALNGIPLAICAGTPSPSNIVGVNELCANNSTILSLTTTYDEIGITYQWKASLTPGGPYDITLGTSHTQSTGNLTTTTYYICEITCSYSGQTFKTPEKAIIVKPLPTVTASHQMPVCVGGNLQLLGNTDGDTYNWTGPNGFSSTSLSPLIENVTLVHSGSYQLTAYLNGCQASSTTNVSVKQTPSELTITPSTAQICQNQIQKLEAKGGEIVNIGTIGTGTTGNTTSTPYKGFWGGVKNQYLYTAAELSALGLTAGSKITSIGFKIISYTGPYTFKGFTIKMKHTNSTSLTSTFEAGTQEVFAPIDLVLTGTPPFTTIHELTTPFEWNGTSNIIIETCFNNNDGGGSSSNSASVESTTQANNMVTYLSIDNTPDLCDRTSGTTSTTRPNVIIGYKTQQKITWAPNTDLYTDEQATIPYDGNSNAPIIYAKPSNATTYTYTATAMSNDGCSKTAQTTITVKPIPSVPTITVQNNCGNSVLTASNYTGTLLWNTGETTETITVNTSGAYSVKQTVDGCSSDYATETANPKVIPNAPTILVNDDCGYSTLKATNYTGDLLWSTNETTQSITVTTAGLYTVNQTVDGCTSENASANAQPKAVPSSPIVNVENTCNNTSILTATGYTGTLLWSTGETTQTIIVTTPGSYQVTQTVDGCVSAPGSGLAEPKSYPVASVESFANPTACGATDGYINVTNNPNYTYLWNTGATTASLTNVGAGNYVVTVTYNGCSIVLNQTLSDPAFFIVTLSSSDPDNTICQGESVTFTPSGLTSGTYEFFLNGNSLGVMSQYTTTTLANNDQVYVIGTQDGCSVQSNVIKTTVHSLPNPVITGNTNYCAGSYANLTTSDYVSYLWSTGATTQNVSVTAVNNPITVQVTDNNGCVGISSPVNVNELPLPNPVISGNLSYCAGSYTELTTDNYVSYLWSTGATTQSIQATVANNPISVQVTDSYGCVGTSSNVTVSENPLPSVIANASNNPICNGESVTLTGSGAVSYQWSHGIQNGVSFVPSTTTTYTVTGIDANGCSNTAEITVTVNSLPNVTANASATTVNYGQEVTLTGGGASTYQWSHGVTDGVPFMPTTTTTYTVTGTDLNGCKNTASVQVTVILSSEKDILSFEFTNPSATGTIVGNNIYVIVPAGTDVTSLVPIITVSQYATVNPASGVAQNFTNPVNYTVTAQNGSTKTYTVYVDVVQSLPYVQTFDAPIFPPAYWVNMKESTGNLWQRATTNTHSGAGVMRYQYSSTQAATAWAITPYFNLQAGKTYIIQFYQRVESSSYPEKLKVTVGTSKTYTSQTTTIWNNAGGNDLRNTTYILRKATYQPTTSGYYTFGFNCYSNANMWNLYVDSVYIREASSEKDILSFVFTNPSATGVISGNNITVTVPAGTNVTSLVPTITISNYATINPASGVAQDFTNPVQYTVTAEDGSTKIYTVTVLVESPVATFQPYNGATNVPINPTIKITFNAPVRKSDNTPLNNNNVDEHVIFKTPDVNGTNVLFDATINANSTEITIVPTNYLEYNTTYYVSFDNNLEGYNDNPVIVSAASWTTTATPDIYPPVLDSAVVYHSNPSQIVLYFNEIVNIANTNGISVLVNGLPAVVNSVSGSGTSILTLTLASPVSPHVDVIFNYDSAIGNLTDNAAPTPNPASTIQNYPVQNRVLSSEKQILSFNIVNPSASGVINGNNITVLLPAGTDVTSLVTNITISPYASINPPSGTAQNFTNPVQYTVTAEDGSTNVYTVYVDVIQTLPYVQTFDDPTFPPKYWANINAGNGNMWVRTTTNVHSGAGAMAYNYHSTNPANAWAITPYFNLEAGKTYKVTFYQRVRSSTYPEKLRITVGTDKTVNTHTQIIWDNAGGQNLTNTTYIKRTATYIPSVNGLYTFGFNCYSDADMYTLYVDSVYIYEVFDNDVAAGNLINPVNSLCGKTLDTVKVLITNYGNQPASNISVTATITSPDNTNTVLNGTITDVIPANGTYTYALGTINTQQEGTYTVYVSVSMQNDLNPVNDTATFTFTITPPLPLPYSENFDGTTLSGWYGNMTWGTGHGLTNKAIYKNLYSSVTSAWAMSPKVGPITSNTYLTFDYRITNYGTGAPTTLTNNDSIYVWAVSCDNEYLIYTITGTNHTPTTNFTTVQTNLSAMAGEKISIYFYLKWGAGDYYVDIDNINIFESQPPTVEIIGGNASICEGNSHQFVATSNQNVTYEWREGSLTGPIVSTTNTLTVNTSGTYYVIVKNSLGQSSNTYATLTVNPLPVVNLGNSRFACANDTIILNAGNFASYNWNIPGITGQIANLTSDIVGIGTTNVSVTVTDNNLCSNSASVNVTFYQLPTVFLGNDTAICTVPSTLLLDAGPGLQYLWSNGATTQTYLVSSDETVSVTVTDPATGCKNTDEITVLFNPAVDVEFGYSTKSFCTGSPVELNAGYFVGATYQWFELSNPNTVLATTQVYTPTTSGIYVVSVINNCNSSDKDTVEVIEHPLPTATVLSGGGTFCPGEVDTILLQFSGTGPWSFVVTDGTNQWTYANIPVSLLQIVDTVTNSAVYTIQTISDQYCTNVGTGNVEHNLKPAPTVELGFYQPICEGSSKVLDAGAQTAYLWSTGETTQTIVVTQPGMYYVTVYNEFNCWATDDYLLNVNPLPVVNLGSDTMICENDDLILDAGPDGISYVWSVGNLNTQTITVNNLALGLGTTPISVTVTNEYGCSATDEILVTIDVCQKLADNALVALNIYPNPSKGIVNIDFGKVLYDTQLELYNSAGQIIEKISINGMSRITLDLSDYPKGVYSMRVINSNEILRGRITIQ